MSPRAYVRAGVAGFDIPDVLLVFDTATNALLDEIVLPVDSSEWVAVSPDGARVIVSGTRVVADQEMLVMVDTVSHAVVDTAVVTGVVVIGRPVFSPDGARLYLSIVNPPGLITFDAATLDELQRLVLPVPATTDTATLGFAVTPDGAFGYLAPTFPEVAPRITVVDLARNAIQATIPAPECDFPGGLSFDAAVTPDGKRVFVPVAYCDPPAGRASGVRVECVGDCSGNGVVSIDELIVGVNLVLTSAVPQGCPTFDRNQDDRVTVEELIAAVNVTLLGCEAARQSSNFVVEIDAERNEVVQIIDIGAGAIGGAARRPALRGGAGGGASGLGIELTSDGRRAYVTGCEGGSSLCEIDIASNAAVAVIETADLPFEVAITPDDAFVYVTGIGNDGRILVVDTADNTLIDRLGPIDFPSGIAIGVPPGEAPPTPTPQVSCADHTSADVPKAIPDLGSASSTVSVASAGPVASLRVGLRGTHSYVADLRFRLVSPSGAAALIVDGAAAFCPAADFDLRIDSQSSSPIPCPPTDGGVHAASHSLAPILGTSAAGVWTLEITDAAPADVGELAGWSLRVCTAVQ